MVQYSDLIHKASTLLREASDLLNTGISNSYIVVTSAVQPRSRIVVHVATGKLKFPGL